MFNWLIKAVRTRGQGWARRRQGTDTAPVRLGRRRIYILPTGFGLIYGALVFAMLLGSMNYNNSLGFALTFLLTGLGLVAMHHCHRNLSGLTISAVHADEVFAGETLHLQVGLENPNAIRRFAIELDCSLPAVAGTGATRPALLHGVAAASRALATVQIPTQHRGWLRPDRLTVSTRFPFGLFRAWSWLHLPIDALVFPRPAGEQSPPFDMHAPAGAVQSRQRGTEDFRGFRDYVPGDSPRHVAWKALARGAPLMVKDYSGAASAPVMLDFTAVTVSATESRLSQLCRWVLDAERDGRPFGLRLPQLRIAARSGAAQRRRCLEALALFNG